MFDEKRFRAQMVLADVSMRQLAEILGIDESTLYRKIKAGGTFSRDQINTMIPVLKITEPMDIFFTQELA